MVIYNKDLRKDVSIPGKHQFRYHHELMGIPKSSDADILFYRLRKSGAIITVLLVQSWEDGYVNDQLSNIEVIEMK